MRQRRRHAARLRQGRSCCRDCGGTGRCSDPEQAGEGSQLSAQMTAKRSKGSAVSPLASDPRRQRPTGRAARRPAAWPAPSAASSRAGGTTPAPPAQYVHASIQVTAREEAALQQLHSCWQPSAIGTHSTSRRGQQKLHDRCRPLKSICKRRRRSLGPGQPESYAACKRAAPARCRSLRPGRRG